MFLGIFLFFFSLVSPSVPVADGRGQRSEEGHRLLSGGRRVRKDKKNVSV